MIVSNENFINFDVSIDKNDNKKFTITLYDKFTEDQLKHNNFFVSLRNNFFREILNITDQIKPDITNEFVIKSKDLTNNSGNIRIYATKDNKNGYPIKTLYSKKKSLGFYGGANTESLLKFKPTSNLDNLLYKVVIIDEIPVVEVYQEDGFNYIEKFILSDFIFKAGILPNIFSDIYEKVHDNEVEITNASEWKDFFKQVENKTDISLDPDNREENLNVFAKYLNTFKYRDKLFADIKFMMESETEN